MDYGLKKESMVQQRGEIITAFPQLIQRNIPARGHLKELPAGMGLADLLAP